jgi:uncharacterized protein (DUF1778 family)
MPSDLPRLTAYVTPETRAVLDEAAVALGQSRSHLVGELLDSAVPVLRALIDAAGVIRDAGQMQRDALRATADDIASITTQGESLQASVLDLMGRLAQDGQRPPPSNTGVRK